MEQAVKPSNLCLVIYQMHSNVLRFVLQKVFYMSVSSEVKKTHKNKWNRSNHI